MIAIVMAYYNRQDLLDRTLESFLQYDENEFEVIIVDDASPIPVQIKEYPFLVTVITIAKQDKDWIMADPSYNIGIGHALKKNADIIILQNPECYHSGNILEYANTVTDETYITFGCYSRAKGESLTAPTKDKICDGNGLSGWYNHPIHRPVAFHFCSAITANNMRKINGFDERFSDGYWYDDDYLLHQIRTLGLKVEITSEPFVSHQYHESSAPSRNMTNLIAKNEALLNRLKAKNEYRALHLRTPDFECKIYDCFIFFNELELLELRLETLNDTVDYFVLVEIGMTFTGKPKELYFENNKHRFEKYLHKIIHIKRDKLKFRNAWQTEFDQRNLINEGVKSAHAGDYIIISDVDEIPNPIAIEYGISKNYNSFGLVQSLFYYFVNCLANQKWNGSVVIKKRLFDGAQSVRNKRDTQIYSLEDGGWHYSFLGGSAKIKAKLEAYAETQTNIAKNKADDHINECLTTGKDLFHRTDIDSKKKFISLKEITHKQIPEWLKKYPTLWRETY